MLLKLGVKRENVWLCDLAGLVHHGRTEQMTDQKAAYAQGTTPATLAEVIDVYSEGGRGAGKQHPLKDPLIRPFPLTAQEKEDLLAFLNALTDASLLTDPRFSNPWRAR